MIEIKEVDKWVDYKKLRNEIIFDIRKVKLVYFKRKFDEVKIIFVYWNLLFRVINFKVWKLIGLLKCDDEFFVVDDKEKVDLLNCFFVIVGMKLVEIINL